MRWTINGSGDAQSRVEYGLGGSFNRQTGLVNGTGAQTQVLTGLASCSAYTARIRATGGGFNINSDAISFTTLGMAPAATNPVASQVMQDHFTVAWSLTGADDVTSFLEFGTTTSYGQSTSVQSGTGSHTAMLAGLTQNTDYHFRVQVRSACGNTQSGDATQHTAMVVPIDIFGSLGAASYGPGGAATGGPVTVNLGGRTSLPLVFVIHNKDSMQHTWNLASTPPYNSGSISAGATVTMTPSIVLPAGTYTISCSFHTGMSGTVQVTA